MLTSKAFVFFLCSVVIAASPVPGKTRPITKAEWAALKANGLLQRDVSVQGRAVNVPTTSAERTALEADGLDGHNNTLQARSGVINCGQNVYDTERIGGKGVGWVPVGQFNDMAEKFCDAVSGNSLPIGHETADTYAVSLTKQGELEKTGTDGNVIFAIYNYKYADFYNIDSASCYDAMVAPINAYKNNKKEQGNKCFGAINSDYEGGYYYVDGVGAFGSEVHRAKPAVQ
ncbi:hypothetical protein EJ08DRAFT_656711 [Tothia fuscella]|uniref:Uncharacterized protein n=1 Tax=Tothia fuscella TaxID=1048955 RepID=A0A9P4P0L7_9PEZI|nr:hypothetical protein EJ08DRAFT_656711 [Tothia fuscella]